MILVTQEKLKKKMDFKNKTGQCGHLSGIPNVILVKQSRKVFN